MVSKVRTGPMPAADRRLGAARLTIILGVVGAILMVSGSLLWSLYALGEGDGVGWRIVGVVSRVLYPGREGNVTTWYSAALLLLLAVGFGGHAYLLARADRAWRACAALGVIAAVLSADESAAIHEQLGRAAEFLDVSVSWTFGWLILGIPFAVAAAAALLWLARALPPALRRRLITAGVLFLGGALGMEAVGGWVVSGESGEDSLPGGVAYQLAQLAEEGLEVAGILVALWAVLTEFRAVRTPDGLMLGSTIGEVRAA